MELYQLQSFIAVAQTGSLSKAAVARNISLSGISKHIKMLEEDIRLTKSGLARKHRAHFLQISLWVVFLDISYRLVAELLQNYIQMRYDNLNSAKCKS